MNTSLKKRDPTDRRAGFEDMRAAVAAKWMGLLIVEACDDAVERHGHIDDEQ